MCANADGLAGSLISYETKGNIVQQRCRPLKTTSYACICKSLPFNNSNIANVRNKSSKSWAT